MALDNRVCHRYKRRTMSPEPEKPRLTAIYDPTSSIHTSHITSIFSNFSLGNTSVCEIHTEPSITRTNPTEPNQPYHNIAAFLLRCIAPPGVDEICGQSSSRFPFWHAHHFVSRVTHHQRHGVHNVAAIACSPCPCGQCGATYYFLHCAELRCANRIVSVVVQGVRRKV